ncbi:lysine-specific demethylase 5B-like isoform X1 [Varroa jacobsoni]|nr:lysine-specific demethylase 5B-like isoform X1 [Varroa jacobsoni]
MADDTEFVPPPQCHVFEPTAEDFKDPLAYIAKIRHVAETSGICKVIPPKDWQPPFVVDVDNFRFTPRVQRLSELEASSRLKLNFLDKIAKFWHLRGNTLKIPMVERKSLDLFKLHRIVQSEGGFHKVGRERKWFQVVQRLGLPPVKSLSTVLRNHYERILLPYDIFKQTGGYVAPEAKPTVKIEEVDRDYVPHEIVQRQNIPPPSTTGQRRSKRHCDASQNEEGASTTTAVAGGEVSDNKELKRLAFYGAGPKLPGYSPPKKKTKDEPIGDEAVAHIMCKACEKGDDEDRLLLCDKCDAPFHTFCLRPPLNDIPKGEWRCPGCVASEVLKPKEAFGFEQARQEYTLQEFGEKADRFKRDYFHMPIHKISTEVVEKEFWKVLSEIHADVTVEYGADLHSAEVGSGFPTENTPGLMPEDREYVTCPWNLNNLANLSASVLRHIDSDISGMKVPWVYVGMCFSTFCWHNEDHWSYSINYLHWGEPKTWYGVPGDAAEKFESAMAAKAPELFEAQPDLLHQLVTIMNPTVMQASGVPIFRVDQKPGEFIITFPRAYHAGFNQGYNFAEAVNFCPADWLPIGRACVRHYALLNRFCVFSHDELVCKMASDPDKIDIGLAAATFHDMLNMVEGECQLRNEVSDWGVTKSERLIFEIIPDDERQCATCKTTCFLSAITCQCREEKSHRGDKENKDEKLVSNMVCLNHAKNLCHSCKPSQHILKYRYALDELPTMLENLRRKVEAFDEWVRKIKELLVKNRNPKPSLEDLKALLNEANEHNYPSVDVGAALKKAVRQAETYAQFAQQLLATKVRTRRQDVNNQPVGRLTKEELAKFYQEMQTMQCTIKETSIIRGLMDNVENFCTQAEGFLKMDDFDESIPLEKLKELTVRGESLDVELPQLTQLRHKMERVGWLRRVNRLLAARRNSEDAVEVSLQDIRGLLREGVNLAPHRNVESRAGQLQQLLVDCERRDDWAAEALKAKPKPCIADVEPRLQEALKIPVTLPSVLLLEEAFFKAKDWVEQMQELTSRQRHPYLEQLEALMNKAKHIQLGLEPSWGNLERIIDGARAWRERAAKTFMKKNTPAGLQLLDILSPRDDPLNSRGVRINKKDEISVAEAFEAAAAKELDYYRRLRRHNQLRRQRRHPNNGNFSNSGDDLSILEEKHCICHRPFTRNMLQCVLCNDFFHLTCVPPSCIAQAIGAPGDRSPTGGNGANGEGSSSAGESSGKSQVRSTYSGTTNLTPPKFLCVWCQRGRRPRLETILHLLVQLENLPVRVVEGEALQWLTERAMLWQNKARQALQGREVIGAVQKLHQIAMMIQQGELEHLESTYGFAAKRNSSGAQEGWYYSRPLVHLPGDILAKLEDLMMEGDLLEVSLEETMSLWRVISSTRSNLPPLSASGFDSAEDSPRKRGRKPGSASEDGRRRRAQAPAGAVSLSVQEYEDSSSGGGDEEDDDDEDKCSADQCERPEGEAVNWVQCDGGCDKWFHMRCVGLPDDHQMDDDFICSVCSGQDEPSAAGGKLQAGSSRSALDSR